MKCKLAHSSCKCREISYRLDLEWMKTFISSKEQQKEKIYIYNQTKDIYLFTLLTTSIKNEGTKSEFNVLEYHFQSLTLAYSRCPTDIIEMFAWSKVRLCMIQVEIIYILFNSRFLPSPPIDGEQCKLEDKQLAWRVPLFHSSFTLNSAHYLSSEIFLFTTHRFSCYSLGT